MRVSSLSSDGLHTHRISIQQSTFWAVVQREIGIMDVQPAKLQQVCVATRSIWSKLRAVSIQSVLNLCHEGWRHF